MHWVSHLAIEDEWSDVDSVLMSSYLARSGLDAIGRVWDLRSGKTAMVLDGHVRDILAIDFAPNGYVCEMLSPALHHAHHLTPALCRHQIATGSNDDTVRIWDMRSLKAIYTIPAHKSAIADVKFYHAPATSSTTYPVTSLPRGFAKLDVFADANQDKSSDQAEGEETPDLPLSGSFLVSGGYDGLVKVWSADDWQLVKSMTSDASGKVMSVDVSSGEFRCARVFVIGWELMKRFLCTLCDTDARFIASAEYSRTFKLWSAPDVDLD